MQTPQEKSAFINAQTQMMIAERDVMHAENQERAFHGESPAYGSSEWEAFRQRWEAVLGYNALIQFFR